MNAETNSIANSINGDTECVPTEEAALLHAGVCYRLYRITHGQQPLVVRIPTQTREVLNERNSHSSQQSIEKIARRYNHFAATGHCVRAPFVWSEKSVPPYGALATQYVAGRSPNLTEDLFDAAECLLRLHQSGTDPDSEPFDMHTTIYQHMQHLESAPIKESAKDIIKDLIKNMPPGEAPATNTSFPIMADAHPGNFVITEQSDTEQGDTEQSGKTEKTRKKRMLAVDVESYHTGKPVWDLAHFSLFSSMLWHNPSCRPPKIEHILRFYADYFELNAKTPTATRIADKHLTRSNCPVARRQVLCRTLGWMLRLLSLTDAGEIFPPNAAVDTAHRILLPETLKKIIKQEEQLEMAWQTL